MKNADKPISPIFSEKGFLTHDSNLEDYKKNQLSGLTKREYFAGLAMQGLLSNNSSIFYENNKIIETSILFSNELLKQLDNESKTPKENP